MEDKKYIISIDGEKCMKLYFVSQLADILILKETLCILCYELSFSKLFFHFKQNVKL